jgi:hypothetical protein
MQIKNKHKKYVIIIKPGRPSDRYWSSSAEVNEDEKKCYIHFQV